MFIRPAVVVLAIKLSKLILGLPSLEDKYYFEQTDIFEVDLGVGCLRFLHHSSEDDKDLFFFPFAMICARELVMADCQLKKGSRIGSGGGQWKYLDIVLQKE